MVIYVLPQVKNKLLGMKGARPVGHIIEELVIPEWSGTNAVESRSRISASPPFGE